MNKQTCIPTIGICLLFSLILANNLFGQYCDASTPSMTVDLTGSPTMNWISPSVVRDGNCCGTSNPDRCLEFIITLHPAAVAINFNIASGAIPAGAMFYQIDCGPQTSVGSPICLSGPGPHHLTFCKPGGNSNTFSITSITDPAAGPDTTIQMGCANFIYASGFEESSIVWTSIFPGSFGAYDNYLSCNSGCDTTIVTGDMNAPSYVDYLVCGSSAAGCGNLNTCDTVRVYFTAAPQVSIDEDTLLVCPGQSVQIDATISGGTAPYTILWDTGENTASILATAGVHIIEVTDVLGCTDASDTVLVMESAIEIDLSAVEPLCNSGSNGAITCVVSGGFEPYVYQWSTGSNAVSIVDLEADHYEVEVTDALGCTETVEIDLEEPLSLAGVIQGDSILCPEEDLILTAQVTGGTGSYSYSWSPTLANDITLYENNPSSQTYYCTITDINNCSIVLQKEIIVKTLEVGDLAVTLSDDTICMGEAISMTGLYFGNSSDINLTWEFCPTCPFTETLILAPTSTTEFILIATNSCGQEIRDTATLVVIDLPQITLPAELGQNCLSIGIHMFDFFEENVDWSYEWSFGDGTTSNSPFHFYGAPGTYPISVIVTGENGCSVSETNVSQVTILPQSVAAFSTISSELATTETIIQFMNHSDNADIYLWSFGDYTFSNEVNPTHLYNSGGNFQVQLIANSMYNCPDTAYFTLLVKPGYALYVPNAFTPDNDQYNNYFLSTGYGISSEDFKMEIYDRWGTLVFETKEKETGWDGYQASKPDRTQDGVFSWVIHFKDTNGIKHVEEGHLSLLK